MAEAMFYLPELYYFQDQQGFPFRQALLTTAVVVSRWCTHFHAQVLVPKRKGAEPLQKSGRLPGDLAEREHFVAELVQWLWDRSMMEDVFNLRLDDEPVHASSDKIIKFDHPDDTCCWTLHLSAQEFAQLQAAWKRHGLPEDLFYPEQRQRIVPYPGTGLKAKVLRALGVRKCYTPRQWEHERETS